MVNSTQCRPGSAETAPRGHCETLRCVLILVRHGRTPANAAGLLQGRLDQDLDALGERQAEAVAAFVDGLCDVDCGGVEPARAGGPDCGGVRPPDRAR